MAELVLVEIDDDGVARLRLNRPESANGMNVALVRELHSAIMRLHSDSRVRAVLLSGEGNNFCAGGDVKAFAEKGDALPDYIREATAWLQMVASALIRLRPPVIAAVRGYAAGGGGLGLVCAADLVIAGESAKFLAGATRVGMAPDAGSTVMLSQLVGLRRAMEIFLTNRELSAAEALEIGLITRVVPDAELEAASLALVRELAEGASRAQAATKRLVWDGLGAPVEARLSEEARTVAELAGTADAREGLAAVIERRDPVFRGRW